RLRIASLEYTAGRRAEAQRIIDRVLSQRPRDVEAKVAKARMLRDAGKIQAAATEAREATTIDGNSEHAHYVLALTALAARHFVEADKELRKVIELNPRAAAGQ